MGAEMNEREALKLALEVLEDLQGGCTDSDDGTIEAITVCCPEVINDIKEALAQPEQEPVEHAVIAGALFDFMGWLTSRKERIVLSSADEASPAVNAIIDFAKMRGLSLNDAKVQDWNTTPPQRKPLTDEQISDMWCEVSNADFVTGDTHVFARAIEAAHGIKGE